MTEVVTDITFDEDQDCGYVTQPTEHYFNAGYVTESFDLSYDLGATIYDHLYTQANIPDSGDNVLMGLGVTVSWVAEYDSENNTITTEADPLTPLPRDFTEMKMWDSNKNKYLNYYTLTIVPDPADALVLIVATGYLQSGNTITVPEGTLVSIQVSKTGYFTESVIVTVTDNQTINVTLQYQPYTAGQVLFESNTAGTYTFTPEVPCIVQIDVVGGGGGGASAVASNFTSGFQSVMGYGCAGGGSGNYNSGEYNLSSIEYQIVVGNKGNGSSWSGSGANSATGGTGGTTSFGSLISATGGTGGYAWGKADPNGATGSDSRAGVGYNNGQHYNWNGTYNSGSYTASGGAGWNQYAAGGPGGRGSGNSWANDGGVGYIKVTFLRYN